MTLWTLIETLAFWGIVVLVHECSHVLAFSVFKKKVGVKITPLGFEAGTGSDVLDLKPWQLMIVSYAGITGGMLPFIVFKRSVFETFLYALICAQDLIFIGISMTRIKSQKTMFEIEFDNYKKYAKERGIKIWRTERK